MRRWLKIAIPAILLAGGAVICAIRWQAWFGMPAEPQWNGDTINYVFSQPTGATDQTFLVLGDIHSRLTRADYDTLAARVPDADAVIQIGDWLERGQDYYYQLLLREWTNSALYGLPAITTPGNHEYSKGIHKTLSPVWEHAFPHPLNGPKDVPGASYFIDLPAVRLIAIDTNPLVRVVDLTRTMTWLRQTMNSADGRFIVVIMHHPVLSVAKGRANVTVYSAFRRILADADLVIAGHDHSYMRRAPFVVLNTAGKNKPQQYKYVPEVTDTVPVYGVLQISNLKSQISNLQFNVYRFNDNTLIDSLYVNHD